MITYSIENESPTIVRHFEQLRMKGPVISFSAIASNLPRFESVISSSRILGIVEMLPFCRKYSQRAYTKPVITYSTL